MVAACSNLWEMLGFLFSLDDVGVWRSRFLRFFLLILTQNWYILVYEWRGANFNFSGSLSLWGQPPGKHSVYQRGLNFLRSTMFLPGGRSIMAGASVSKMPEFAGDDMEDVPEFDNCSWTMLDPDWLGPFFFFWASHRCFPF